MKAKELLKEIVKAYPDVVAIAQYSDKTVYVIFEYIPFLDDFEADYEWLIVNGCCKIFNLSNIIEWDSENWKENIITINDLKDELN